MTKLNPNHVEWCRQHFRMIAEGGVWTLPRSGMIFTKRKHTLVLIEAMPHMEEMPCTVDELRQQQRDELAMNRLYFGAVGVTILDEVGL